MQLMLHPIRIKLLKSVHYANYNVKSRCLFINLIITIIYFVHIKCLLAKKHFQKHLQIKLQDKMRINSVLCYICINQWNLFYIPVGTTERRIRLNVSYKSRSNFYSCSNRILRCCLYSIFLNQKCKCNYFFINASHIDSISVIIKAIYFVFIFAFILKQQFSSVLKIYRIFPVQTLFPPFVPFQTQKLCGHIMI